MPDHDTYYDFSNICIRSEPEKSELCMLFAAYREIYAVKGRYRDRSEKSRERGKE